MSVPEFHLRAAAGAINRMPGTDLERALRQVKERRNARSQMEVLQQQTELASLELEQAAYQLASEAEAKGDLLCAARWYTAAALNDFADASLKLAKILDALAGRHLHAREGNVATREERDLLSEACRWYSDAIAAGETEAEELLDRLIERHLGRSGKNTAVAGGIKPGPRPSRTQRQSRPPSDRTTAGPDRIPTAEPHHTRTLQNATDHHRAGDHPALDRDQPGLAGIPKNHGK